MKKRIHLKRRKKLNKIHVFLWVLIFLVISCFYLLKIIDKHFTPILLEVAELEINKFSTILSNKAIAQVLEDKINTDDLFDTLMSDSGEIQMIDFNPIVVNQVLNVATSVVQNNLKLLEEGELDTIGVYDMDLPEDRLEDLKKGIIAKIPIGVITGNSLLSNLGPEIPVRLHYLGDVNSNVSTKITQYGINNVLVEIGVDLEITAQIILPFVTDQIKLEYNIPLAIKMIQGKIPDYYGNGLTKYSNLFSLPLEE